MKWQQTLSSTNQNVLVSQMNHQKPWTTLMSVTSRCHWNIFPYPGHVLRARVILCWENWVALWLCLWSEVSNFLRWNKTSTCSCSWLLQELLSILRPFVREDTFLFFDAMTGTVTMDWSGTLLWSKIDFQFAQIPLSMAGFSSLAHPVSPFPLP